MKAIQVQQFGAPEVLQLVEIDHLRPTADQILVRVHASGVNPFDTYLRSGVYPVLPDLPWTPGFDGAGKINALGAEVEGFTVGDRVWLSGSLTGTAAEFALCSPDQVHPLSDDISFAIGASLGIPAAAAWRALFIRGCAKPGETVLIHGASGVAGQATVQLARAAGLRVLGTAGNRAGKQVVLDAGAHDVYLHGDEGLSREKIDLIIEMLANHNLETDLQLLAPGGRVVIVGSRGRIEIDPRLTMGKEIDVRGMSLFAATAQEKEMTFAAIGAALEVGVLCPRIAAERPLSEAAQTHEMVLKDLVQGKILLRP
ncbi:MAG: NADPH:quinone reductase [Geopsychrobacter sp.]|nr:NADPH:quinone reductase [Geopsychrobacter sp.]